MISRVAAWGVLLAVACQGDENPQGPQPFGASCADPSGCEDGLTCTTSTCVGPFSINGTVTPLGSGAPSVPIVVALFVAGAVEQAQAQGVIDLSSAFLEEEYPAPASYPLPFVFDGATTGSFDVVGYGVPTGDSVAFGWLRIEIGTTGIIRDAFGDPLAEVHILIDGVLDHEP